MAERQGGVRVAYCLGALICVTVLIQGGYFPINYLPFGVVMSLLAVVRRRKTVLSAEMLLWALSLWYVLTSLASGYDMDSLSGAMLHCLCAVFLLIYCDLSALEREKLIRLLAAFSSFAAGAALLSYCGILNLTGSVASHRLQFTFQYANASGSWFAAITLLTQDKERKELRKYALPCAVALLLTRSVGAIGLYAVAGGLCVLRTKDREFLRRTVILHTLALAFALAFYKTDGWLGAVLLISLYLCAWHLDTLVPEKYRSAVCWTFAVAAAGGGIALLLYSQRLRQGIRTLAERAVQIGDGMKIIAAHPLLGTGAGGWARCYRYYQSAQYTSEAVHSSFAQLGVDAGIPGILLGAVFVFVALIYIKRSAAENAAALLLILHSLLDFSCLFFPIDALLLVILFSGKNCTLKKCVCASLPLAATLCVGLMCLLLTFGQCQKKALIWDASTQFWERAVTNYESWHPLYGECTEVRKLYVLARSECGGAYGVLSATEGETNLTIEEICLRADAFQIVGRQDDACMLLLAELSRQEYYIALYEETAKRLRKWDADTIYICAYNQLADAVNSGQTILRTLMGNQVYIERIP